MANIFSEKSTAHEVVRHCFEQIGANRQLSLQQVSWEPVELAQESPRLESDEELLSMEGDHEDDGVTVTALPLHEVRPS